MLGTATKLKTPKNISLTGDVTGSASFDGSNNVIINADLANIAILTGTIPANTGSNSYSSTTINYPNGYTKDNCIIIASEFNNSNSNTIYSTGTILNVGSYVIGAIPASVSLKDSNIDVRISNVYAISGEPAAVYVQKIEVPIKFKIVLMKI